MGTVKYDRIYNLLLYTLRGLTLPCQWKGRCLRDGPTCPCVSSWLGNGLLTGHTLDAVSGGAPHPLGKGMEYPLTRISPELTLCPIEC